MVDPFAAATTKMDMVVPADRIGEVELLASDRKLPKGATNVRLYFKQFQDPFLWVRFDAPLAEAVAFAEAQTGQSLEPGCRHLYLGDPPADWWIKTCPPGARSAAAFMSVDPPARHYLVVPHGAMATVWLETHRD